MSARFVAGALSPLGFVYHQITRVSPVACPSSDQCTVICIGNATVGGVGKTPFAMMVHKMLNEHGLEAGFLSRGYRGNLQGPEKVNAMLHGAVDVGDEALLLAQQGSTWVSKDRAAGLRAAMEAGEEILIADDGFQNAKLQKDISILLVSENSLSGNRHVLPAGPFREPVESAVRRSDMLIFVRDTFDTVLRPEVSRIAQGRPFCEAALFPVGDMQTGKFHAFCGIGNPERFRLTLIRAGYDVMDFTSYPDHYSYTDQDIRALHINAKKNGSMLITTQKDFMRLSEEQRKDITMLQVEMRVNKPTLLLELLSSLTGGKKNLAEDRGSS